MVSSRPAAAFCVEGELREQRQSLVRRQHEIHCRVWIAFGKKSAFFVFWGGSDTEYCVHGTPQSPRFWRFVVFAFASGDNSFCEPYGILILKKWQRKKCRPLSADLFSLLCRVLRLTLCDADIPFRR